MHSWQELDQWKLLLRRETDREWPKLIWLHRAKVQVVIGRVIGLFRFRRWSVCTKDVIMQTAAATFYSAYRPEADSDIEFVAAVCAAIAIKVEDLECESRVFKVLSFLGWTREAAEQLEVTVLNRIGFAIPPSGASFLHVAFPKLSLDRHKGAAARRYVTQSICNGMRPSRAVLSYAEGESSG